jgi:type IV pilus assembly protein PilW
MKTNKQQFRLQYILSHRQDDISPVRFQFRQSGITLVELMIALTLSLLLVAGVLKIFIGNKQTYEVQDAMARVQENGRFALHFMSDDVRMAGFMGCTSPSGYLNVTNNVEVSGTGNNTYTTNLDAVFQNFTGEGAVKGYSYTTGSLPTEVSALGLVAAGNSPVTPTDIGKVMENTDILFIRRAGSCPGSNLVCTNCNSADLKIADNSSCKITQADIVMVSDCKNADIFGVSSNPTIDADFKANISHGANWNKSPSLANGYGPDAKIYKMEADVYYIGVGASGQPALFKRELDHTGGLTNEELVEGIEDMTILYGVDTNNDENPDIYTTADAINADTTDNLDMDNVISIRVTMVARTLKDNVATSTDATYNDKRIRRTFTTTIGIRNRMS